MKISICTLSPTMGIEPELIFQLNGHCHFILPAGSQVLYEANACFLPILLMFFPEVHVVELEALMTKEGKSAGACYLHLRRSPTGATLFPNEREGFLDINYGVGVLAQG